MRKSLQLTKSVILERQFKVTVQSKRKQKKSHSRLGFEKSSGIEKRAVWNSTKKDTQTGHVKHECTRGFKRKSLQMDDTIRLAD